MRIRLLAEDKDGSSLSRIKVLLTCLIPESEIMISSDTGEALKLTNEYKFDAVFLDTGDGMTLAKQIRSAFTQLPIVFTAKDDSFLREAFSVHAAGYLHKPVKREELGSVIEYLFNHQLSRKRLYIQTFGGFCVFLDGNPITFHRSKTKELLAVLVDKRGCSISAREACSILFEDKPYDDAQGSYSRVLVSDLSKTLRKAGAEYILRRSHNQISLDISSFECDAYQFLAGDPEIVNKYNGDYMFCYSWAEYSSGLFEKN